MKNGPIFYRLVVKSGSLVETIKKANYLFVDKKYEEAIGYYTVASRFGQSTQIVADSIANRSACFESLKNNVAALLDCKAALSYGFGKFQ